MSNPSVADLRDEAHDALDAAVKYAGVDPHLAEAYALDAYDYVGQLATLVRYYRSPAAILARRAGDGCSIENYPFSKGSFTC